MDLVSSILKSNHIWDKVIDLTYLKFGEGLLRRWVRLDWVKSSCEYKRGDRSEWTAEEVRVRDERVLACEIGIWSAI